MNKAFKTEVFNPTQILDSVARATKNGFVAINKKNEITHFSSKMEEVTGWHEYEILGKQVKEIYSVKDSALPKSLDDVLSQPGLLYTRDGKKITIETRITPTSTSDDDTSIDGYLIFFVIEDYNKNLDRAQSEFISTVSHELRTPITSIKGFASTLLSQFKSIDEEKAKKYIGIIKDQAERLSRLVEDLLAVSRLESRKLQLTIHPVKVVPIIENIIILIESKYSGSHKINLNTETSIPDTWVDSDRLEQILTNLIDNAVKYSPGKDKVDINIRSDFINDKNMVVVEVIDYGIGIADEDTRTIFTKFSRLDNPLTRQTEGTGLGLYISKSLAKLLHGDLNVESESNSTKFTLTLPTESHKVGEVWWD